LFVGVPDNGKDDEIDGTRAAGPNGFAIEDLYEDTRTKMMQTQAKVRTVNLEPILCIVRW